MSEHMPDRLLHRVPNKTLGEFTRYVKHIRKECTYASQKTREKAT